MEAHALVRLWLDGAGTVPVALCGNRGPARSDGQVVIQLARQSPLRLWIHCRCAAPVVGERGNAGLSPSGGDGEGYIGHGGGEDS